MGSARARFLVGRAGTTIRLAFANPRSAKGSELRVNRIRLAMATSVVSKLATTGMQLLAIPLAIRALGGSQYGGFVVVAASLSWISLGGLGVSPGVTRSVAAAFARGDESGARESLTTGLALAITTALVIAVLLGIGWATGPGIGSFTNASFAPYAAAMQSSLLVVAIAGVAQLPLSVLQAARAGILEQYVTNSWTLAGTLVGVVLMIYVAAKAPSMVAFACALAAPALVAGAGDGLSLVYRHQSLRPQIRAFHRSAVRPLITTGSGFLLYSLGGFLLTQLSVVAASTSLEPASVASIGVVLQVQGLGLGLIMMIAVPLWPSIAHAAATGDFEWVRHAYIRLRRLSLVVGIVGALGIVVGLPSVGSVVFGGQISLTPVVVLPFAFLFLLASWGTIHSYVLFGLSAAPAVGGLMVLQGVLSLLVMFALLPSLGIAAVGMSMCVAALLVTTWALPLMVRKRLHSAFRDFTNGAG